MKKENSNKYNIVLAVLMILFLLAVFKVNPSRAVIQGPCSDCHTMHNSQGSSPLNFDPGDLTPNEYLLRGTCLGCHGMNTGSPTYDLNTDKIPQVYHTGTDLSAGNFIYITISGSNRGHNIINLGIDESPFMYPPPGIISPAGARHDIFWNSHRLSCVSSDENGTAGCHGIRLWDDSFPEGVTGAHHNNVTGSLATADTVGNSYRFLMGVKGYESEDWEQNPSSSNHNEYFGVTTPTRLGCGGAGVNNCHVAGSGSGGMLVPPDGTMSQFCASCHGNFHTLGTNDYDGIGPEATSPFIRHPTDLALPDEGEYAAYTEYSVQAPVARTGAVPPGSGSGINHGINGDAVMCLSCHRAHASPFPDMLRWDYNEMVAGGGGSGGCFTCHSNKN
ncbi:MAG: cytochrome c3 family protein [Desulfobulbaceae bacterium]|nr:cytochrome c3 family protein [Desulfobulbaceae bacterium]